MSKLKTLLGLLIEGNPLPASYLDHPLKGDWKGFRDAHIEPDWLLIYSKHNAIQNSPEGILYLELTGTHSDLFSK